MSYGSASHRVRSYTTRLETASISAGTVIRLVSQSISAGMVIRLVRYSIDPCFASSHLLTLFPLLFNIPCPVPLHSHFDRRLSLLRIPRSLLSTIIVRTLSAWAPRLEITEDVVDAESVESMDATEALKQRMIGPRAGADYWHEYGRDNAQGRAHLAGQGESQGHSQRDHQSGQLNNDETRRVKALGRY